MENIFYYVSIYSWAVKFTYTELTLYELFYCKMNRNRSLFNNICNILQQNKKLRILLKWYDKMKNINTLEIWMSHWMFHLLINDNLFYFQWRKKIKIYSIYFVLNLFHWIFHLLINDNFFIFIKRKILKFEMDI